ncbi:hypothetical protein A3Q56_02384 [Intoshia linei]|uniref:Uncharacterized protein n=1 Tax=Intoshia linei TaxID=1819745 RepID=A0A177B6F4_9BILA|nr:hypothetical protein A3Q56_02384 [Intoshia linei]
MDVRVGAVYTCFVIGSFCMVFSFILLIRKVIIENKLKAVDVYETSQPIYTTYRPDNLGLVGYPSRKSRNTSVSVVGMSGSRYSLNHNYHEIARLPSKTSVIYHNEKIIDGSRHSRIHTGRLSPNKSSHKQRFLSEPVYKTIIPDNKYNKFTSRDENWPLRNMAKNQKFDKKDIVYKDVF